MFPSSVSSSDPHQDRMNVRPILQSPLKKTLKRKVDETGRALIPVAVKMLKFDETTKIPNIQSQSLNQSYLTDLPELLKEQANSIEVVMNKQGLPEETILKVRGLVCTIANDLSLSEQEKGAELGI